jgi:hypothetical protein
MYYHNGYINSYSYRPTMYIREHLPSTPTNCVVEFVFGTHCRHDEQRPFSIDATLLNNQHSPVVYYVLRYCELQQTRVP